MYVRNVRYFTEDPGDVVSVCVDRLTFSSLQVRMYTLHVGTDCTYVCTYCMSCHVLTHACICM